MSGRDAKRVEHARPFESDKAHGQPVVSLVRGDHHPTMRLVE